MGGIFGYMWNWHRYGWSVVQLQGVLFAVLAGWFVACLTIRAMRWFSAFRKG